MTIPVMIVVILLVISKLMDVLSTLSRIRSVNVESNPIARGLMQKMGIKTSVWLIFLVSLTIILIAGSIALSFGILYQVFFVLMGLLVSIVQFSVAHSNWTGKGNLITRYLLRFHKFINQIMKAKQH